MTKEEAIKELEEYLQDADKAFSEDEEYIRGWKSAFLIALEIVHDLTYFYSPSKEYYEVVVCNGSNETWYNESERKLAGGDARIIPGSPFWAVTEKVDVKVLSRGRECQFIPGMRGANPRPLHNRQE